METAQTFFVVQVTIKASPTNPDPKWKLVDGGFAHAIVLASDDARALDAMKSHLAEYGWDMVDVRVCQQTDPANAVGHPHLERMVGQAVQYGIGAEIVPAVLGKDPGPAH